MICTSPEVTASGPGNLTAKLRPSRFLSHELGGRGLRLQIRGLTLGSWLSTVLTAELGSGSWKYWGILPAQRVETDSVGACVQHTGLDWASGICILPQTRFEWKVQFSGTSNAL